MNKVHDLSGCERIHKRKTLGISINKQNKQIRLVNPLKKTRISKIKLYGTDNDQIFLSP